MSVSDDDGYLSTLRRIRVVLSEPTRNGDREIFILTNLCPSVATALEIAQFYRQRWTLETLFQILTVNFNCEIKTLGYPKAALFAFCVALVSYNILSVIFAALRSVYGTDTIQQAVSSYYLADEIRGTYRGMMIAIPPQEWRVFNTITMTGLASLLQDLASHVNLSAFLRHPRSPKKNRRQKKRIRPVKHPHVSTAKLLRQNQVSSLTP
jgi:spore maturation protein SpmB